MAFIPWPDGAMGVCQWTGTLGTWTNRLAFTKPSYVFQDMVDLSNSLNSSIFTAFKSKLSPAVTFYGWDVIDMRSFGAPAWVTPYAGAPGTGTGDEMPPSVCVVVTLRTALRGRAYRGRQYVAGFEEPQITNGVWLAACTDQVLEQWNTWQEVAQNVGWTLCIANTHINKQPRTEAYMVPVISQEIRSGIPGHQRRRDRRP